MRLYYNKVKLVSRILVSKDVHQFKANMNLLELKNYSVSLKVFDNICEEWSLTEADKAGLNVLMIPNEVSLITMSRIISIYKSLRTLFERRKQASAWMHKYNSAFGDCAINVMQTASGLEEVQHYLNAQTRGMDASIFQLNESSNVLFICTANIQRSLTAEHYCKPLYPQIEFKSAGVSRKECERNNSGLCTIDLLEWADQIFVFEQMHIDRIVEHTNQEFVHKIFNLNIDDSYQYMQKELVTLLQAKIQESFRNTAVISESTTD